MIIIDDLRNAADVIFNPTTYNYKDLSFGKAFSMYYKVILLPILIFEIFSTLIMSALILMLHIGFSIQILIILGIVPLIYLVIVPIMLVIFAALLQLIGGYLFHWYKKKFATTLSALVYGTFPSSILLWTIIIPIFGLLIESIASFWGLIIEISALTKLQRTGEGEAILSIIILFCIISILIMIIAFIIFILHSNINALLKNF